MPDSEQWAVIISLLLLLTLGVVFPLCLIFKDAKGIITMNDTLKRAFRTFLQGFVGILALIAVPALNNLVQAVAGGGEVEIDVNFWRAILIAAIAGGLVALIAFVQNWLEEKDAIPKVAK